MTNTDDIPDGADPIIYAILNFALCLVCDIVPQLLIIDSQFIKILTFDMIR